MDFLRHFASASKSTFDALFGGLYPSLSLPANVDLQGKRVLITGGNSGIGKELALALARLGAEVHLLCRNAKKAEDAKQHIISTTGNPQVFVEILDVSLMSNIKEFVAKWYKRERSAQVVDILFNNAGLVSGTKCTTSEGFEVTYATNMLSGFALTIGLLQHGCLAPDARIIQVASCMSYAGYILAPPNNMNSSDLLGNTKEGEHVSMPAMLLPYCRSKALQVAFTIELQSRLARNPRFKGVQVHAYHPGVVRTPIWNDKSGAAHEMVSAASLGLWAWASGIPMYQGAITGAWLATSQELNAPELQGRFWDRYWWRWPPAWMLDAQKRGDAWSIMARDSGLDVDI